MTLNMMGIQQLPGISTVAPATPTLVNLASDLLIAGWQRIVSKDTLGPRGEEVDALLAHDHPIRLECNGLNHTHGILSENLFL